MPSVQKCGRGIHNFIYVYSILHSYSYIPTHSRSYSLSAAYILSSSIEILPSAFSFVAFKKIFGTILSPCGWFLRASKASLHLRSWSAIFIISSEGQASYLVAQRHHLHPPFMPGIGLRSFPCFALKSRNSSVTSAATLWLP